MVFRQFDGRRYGKCGNKLLLNCLPAQMYVKISNVSTYTQTRICYSVCACCTTTNIMNIYEQDINRKMLIISCILAL